MGQSLQMPPSMKVRNNVFGAAAEFCTYSCWSCFSLDVFERSNGMAEFLTKCLFSF